MARSSLNFARPTTRHEPAEPMGLGPFALLSLCFGSLAGLASLIITGRL